MKTFYVITGDISGFTKVPALKREELIQASRDLITSWVGDKHARIFRGDSFQLLFNDKDEALSKCIQLRCWYKKQVVSKKNMLDARMAIGVGQIAYQGESVLDSDGEAFHISGRLFDRLEEDEFVRIMTPDETLNKQLNIICRLMDVIISGWTRGQAEVIYLALQNRTQQQMSEELQVVQSAINNRLRLSKWKEIERAIHYISTLL